MPPSMQHSTPLQHLSPPGVFNSTIPTMQIPFVQNPNQIISEPTNSMNTVKPQMMYSNMSDTNERVKRLEHIMNERLSKLDLLETMAKKLDTFELSISQMRIEIDDIKETQDKHIRIIDKQETHHHNVEGRLRNLENSNRQLEGQNIELRETLLTLQTHSMKYNLMALETTRVLKKKLKM